MREFVFTTEVRAIAWYSSIGALTYWERFPDNKAETEIF